MFGLPKGDIDSPEKEIPKNETFESPSQETKIIKLALLAENTLNES